MKVLFMAPHVPWPLKDETSRRTFRFLEHTARSHETVFFGLAPGSVGMEHRVHFEEMCIDTVIQPLVLNPWRPLRRRLFDPIPQTVRLWMVNEARGALAMIQERHTFDLVHIDDICMAPLLDGLGFNAPVTIDRSRLDYRMYREWLANVENWRERIDHAENLFKLKRFERSMLNRHLFQVVRFEQDRELMQESFGAAGEIAVIRNGIDPDDYPAHPHAGLPHVRIGLACSLESQDSRAGFAWFATRVFPTIWNGSPHAILTAAGNPSDDSLSALSQNIPGVSLKGRAEDIRSVCAESTICICPIRGRDVTGSQIVEAMAMGRPVVSTSIAAKELGLVHETHLLTADTEREFAASVSRLINDEAFAERMAQAGRARVLERFGWEPITKRLGAFHETCVSEYAERRNGSNMNGGRRKNLSLQK